jgi:hypothetical protein
VRRALGKPGVRLKGLPHAALLAQDEEVGELHGWSGAGLQLPDHGSLILPEDVRPAARRQLAGLEIHQQGDFPGFKAIATNLSVQEFAKQAFEAVELALPLLEVIRRGHDPIIGRRRTEL